MTLQTALAPIKQAIDKRTATIAKGKATKARNKFLKSIKFGPTIQFLGPITTGLGMDAKLVLGVRV